MTTETHRHHLQQDTEDNSLFIQLDNDYTGTDYTDGDYAQAPATNFASSAAAAPVRAVSPPTQTLYLTEPGTTSPISVSDINQGQLGDCFLLSSIGEEALFHPSAITNMIHDNGNGTETVTLYTGSNGRLPPSTRPASRPPPSPSTTFSRVRPSTAARNRTLSATRRRSGRRCWRRRSQRSTVATTPSPTAALPWLRWRN